jgi:hypothetical protein
VKSTKFDARGLLEDVEEDEEQLDIRQQVDAPITPSSHSRVEDVHADVPKEWVISFDDLFRTYNINASRRPTIIILDSHGLSHPSAPTKLKKYIVSEGRTKRSLSIEISDIKTMIAKGIPRQDNSSDCGVFTLKYADDFLQNPDGFVSSLFHGDEREAWSSGDVNKMRNELKDLIIRLQKDIKSHVLPTHSTKRKRDESIGSPEKRQRVAPRGVFGFRAVTLSEATDSPKESTETLKISAGAHNRRQLLGLINNTNSGDTRGLELQTAFSSLILIFMKTWIRIWRQAKQSTMRLCRRGRGASFVIYSSMIMV